MKKILVVESSPTILSVTDSLLRQNGYDVACLSNSEEALEFTRSEHPDLILTGIGLDGLDGLELCRQISGDSLIGGIPVIVLIGEKDAPFLEKLPLCGARGTLNKPFSPRDLLGIVEKFTDAGKQSSATIVNQQANNKPKLKAREPVAPTEVESATRTSLEKRVETGKVKRHETVFNLDWEDLSKQDSTNSGEAIGADDSGLILEEDQYGLTNLADEVVPAQKGSDVEDYDWFINSMRDEIDENDKSKPEQKPAAGVTQASAGPTSQAVQGDKKSETKYRQFLEQFKEEPDVANDKNIQATGNEDVDILVNQVTEKLAAKIVEKINSDEIRQIILSILNENK